jgi:uncharacterized glyoxalase superfamily protein PhnB
MTGTGAELFDSLGPRAPVFRSHRNRRLVSPSRKANAMTPQRVTLITLALATSLRGARLLRGAWLGSRQRVQEGVAFYQMHGAVLALFGRADLAADQGRPGATLGTGAMTLAQNFATEAEVDAAYAAALAPGHALEETGKGFLGRIFRLLADPDGHVWEVAMNPFWPLDEDGSLTLPGTFDRYRRKPLALCRGTCSLWIAPGPVWVALTARALSGGFAAAWPLAIGVTIGDLVWPLARSWAVLDRKQPMAICCRSCAGSPPHLPGHGHPSDPQARRHDLNADSPAEYGADSIKVLKGLRPFASAPACISATPTTARACTTWSTRSSTTASTRRWPGTPTEVDVKIHADDSVSCATTAAAFRSTSTGRGRFGGRGHHDPAARRRQIQQHG